MDSAPLGDHSSACGGVQLLATAWHVRDAALPPGGGDHHAAEQLLQRFAATASEALAGGATGGPSTQLHMSFAAGGSAAVVRSAEGGRLQQQLADPAGPCVSLMGCSPVCLAASLHSTLVLHCAASDAAATAAAAVGGAGHIPCRVVVFTSAGVLLDTERRMGPGATEIR